MDNENKYLHKIFLAFAVYKIYLTLCVGMREGGFGNASAVLRMYLQFRNVSAVLGMFL